MLTYQRALRLARWVSDPPDRVPFWGRWMRWRAWVRLERACPSAEEPLLALLWGLNDPAAPDRWRGRIVAALVRNPHELSAESLGLAWAGWLEEPDDTLWEMLRGRAQPAEHESVEHESVANLSRLALGLAPPEEQCAAAIDLDLPEHLRAMLVERCVEQGLTPADPRQRVVFLLLTGQAGQCRAADPDGSLLTAVYREASGRRRARLRAAMVDAGDLDLVRVITGGDPARHVRMRPEERDYLAEQLTARGDWPALWQLLPQLPLVDAVAAVRSFRDGWRPGDDRGRALFARLSAMPPEELAAGLAGLAPTRTVHIAPGGSVEDCALSPDGTRLAVAITWVVDGQIGCSVVEYELPAGRLVARYEKTGTALDRGWFRHLLHTGDAVIAALGTNVGYAPLIAYADGGRQILTEGGEGQGEVVALAHTRGGFAALTSDQRLFLGGADGQTGLRQVRLPELIGYDGPWSQALAGEPAAGLLAVCGWELLIIDQDATRIIARDGIPGISPGSLLLLPESMIKHVQFIGPDQLVTGMNDSLTRWSIDGDTFIEEATAEFLRVDHVTALPRHHRLVVRTDVRNDVGKNRWKFGPPFLDATTLREATPPAIVKHAPESMAQTWSTPSGDHLAVMSTTSTVTVHGRYPHPAVHLLERPLADLAPSALATVSQAAARLPPGAAREVLKLLQTCLEHRVASETAPRGLDGNDRAESGTTTSPWDEQGLR